MESPAKSGEKYIHVFWYIVFKVLKLLLIKKYKIELVNQFLYFVFIYIDHISFYISRYDFLQLFRTLSIKKFMKKDFHHRFLFFNRYTQTPKSFHSQNRPAKRDESYLLKLPKFAKFMALYLGCGCMTF